MKGKSRFWVIAFAVLFVGTAHTQNRDYAGYENAGGKHRGAVTALLRDADGRIISAGEDGFLIIWDLRKAEERFQVSRYAIEFMAARPGKPEVAVVESDGFGVNSVSVWNYETKKRLFTLRFRDSVSGINYSAAGNFLIVSRSGPEGTVLLDPETGEALDSPELPPSITLASTGLSERSVLCYQPSGVLSYWNLIEGSETRRFNVPSNIQNPVLFGNNRFMAGFDSGGLLVLDAVTGSVLGRETDITRGSVFIESADSACFYCVSAYDSGCTIYRMEMSPFGILTTIESHVLFIDEVSRGIFAADNIILGAGSGDLWLVNREETRVLETQNQEGILDIAASSLEIALVSENGTLVYLPLDYSSLEGDFPVTAEAPGGNHVYTKISSSPLPGESRFLLWEPGCSTPMVISPVSRLFLDKIPIRSQLRSAAMLGGNILFLDTTGVVSVLDRGSGETLFTTSAAGSVDAAFVDAETIIIGRYATPGDTPFIAVNFRTGETTPLACPGNFGLKVYRGASGAVYAAVLNQEAGNVRTSIVALDLSNPSESQTIATYDGEEPFVAMAESGGNFAAAPGSGMAALYANHQTRPEEAEHEKTFFEGGSFPVKIIDGGRFFVVLDADGAVSWYDNQTVELLAVFRLYRDFWLLEKTTPLNTNREITRGGVINAPPRQ